MILVNNLNKTAFFFQGVSILLPAEGFDITMSREIPLVYSSYFPDSDIFTIPAIDNTPGGAISCVYVPNETILPADWQLIPVRQTLSLLTDCTAETGNSVARMLRAFHIAQWRQESRFCGSCGGKNNNEFVEEGGETARLCPVCGRMEFPRIAPAVITLIMNDKDEILLAHNKKFPPGLYSLIAGFVEAGENLEAAVAREIREEVNIEICEIRYAVSQPWPFPNSLMVGFSARYASGTIKPDGDEIEDAQWFNRGNLPKLPGSGSVSRLLIEHWLANTT